MGEVASREQLRLSFARWAVVTVPLVLLLGFASGRMVPAGSGNGWYAGLAKPWGTPPDWMFPVAWGTIYVCLGLAAALVLNARGARGRWAGLALFAGTLAAALAWMPVFFGAHRVGLALAVALVMLALGTATAVLFGRVRRPAGWLVVPFLVWTAYAAVLTWRIDRLNPHLAPDGSRTQIIG